MPFAGISSGGGAGEHRTDDLRTDAGGVLEHWCRADEGGSTMSVRTDERGLIGKILLIWLVILGLVVVALIDGGSIVLARLRTNDLARDTAFAAEQRYSETGKRRQAVRAALAAMAESDEDARLVELDVSDQGDVTVVVTDRAGTLLVGRLGFFEHLTETTASVTAS